MAAVVWLGVALLMVWPGLGWSSEAQALRTIEQAGTYLYYPSGEQDIAAGLARQLPDMRAFLAQQGLPVDGPLHVILDEKLDLPEAVVSVIPHSEIRIPLRAPGVLEDGYLEADPWGYFLFRGLCLQGLYRLRGGIPQALHGVFGEVVSPNAIVPQWLEDGICVLLYRTYSGHALEDPFYDALFTVSSLPDMARLSNHPGVWPGYYAHRIYGRPFIRWVHARYGWEKLRDFLAAHGAGIIPIEIDLKAQKTLGKSWVAIWNEFRAAQPARTAAGTGLLIDGFWPEPFTYWNIAGVFPGMERYRLKGRYGYRDAAGSLWISEYDDDDIAHCIGYRDGGSIPLERDHVWDPGVGGIAVTRQGRRPALVALETPRGAWGLARIQAAVIPGPAGVIALSGPVRNARGVIAVAANSAGNWDIWTYDGAWQRLTEAPSIEMDPWWDGDRLLCASNASGVFQICDTALRPLTASPHGAILPRQGRCLELDPAGWHVEDYPPPGEDPAGPPPSATVGGADRPPLPASKPYTPWPSILPNYIVPDVYIGDDDVQLGLATWSRDVSKDFTTDAGIRYSFQDDYLSLRLGSRARHIAAQGSRYPLSYSSNLGTVDESRIELKLAFIPFLDDPDLLSLSLNRLSYEPLENGRPVESDLWGALQANKTYGNLAAWGTFETYSGGSQSLYGGLRLRWGKDIYGLVQAQAGKTWGGYAPGHGSFRIGGDTGEGYFTRRPSRLFPLRGFSSDTLEADQAVTASLELYWPLINIQKGYETLPLFLHRIRLGTFVDAGACRERMQAENTLVGAGLELVTAMEIAWGYYSSFRLGVAWPVRQPDDLDERGPVFLLQIGRPL